MKIIDFIHKETPGKKLVKGWLFTLNLFFFLYSAVMLGEYLLGPDSGRLSTLVCKPGVRGPSVCTVKIFGIRKIYRQDFYAYNYIETLISYNFEDQHPPAFYKELALPWGTIGHYDQLYDSSPVCAVSIRTGPQIIDFVPPYQSPSNCKQAETLIKDAFAGDRDKIDVQFNGYNPFIYMMASLVVISCLALIGQSTPRFIRWIKNTKASRGIDNQGIPAQFGDVVFEPEIPRVSATEQVNPLISKAFILRWWAANAPMFLFVIVFFILVSKSKVGGATYACFISIRDYQGLLLRPLLRNMVAISPLIILTLMQSVLQWQVLRLRITVSRWWFAAPIMAGIPLLLILPANLNCLGISGISWPMVDVTDNIPYYPPTIMWIMIGYFFIIGIIQWLVLRKSLRFSMSWMIAPLLSAVIPGILLAPLGILFYLGLIEISIKNLEFIMWPYSIIVLPILFTILTSFSFLSGFYLYRLIRLRTDALFKATQTGDTAVTG